MKRNMIVTLALLMVFSFFTSTAFANEGEAHLRVIHASPDAPAVDIYVNEELTLENFEYKGATDYLALPEGSYQIDIFPAGVSEGDPVLSETVSVDSGNKYTLAAVGNLENIELLATVEDTTVAEGKTKVRFIHASPDAPEVDIAVKDGDVIFSNAGFKGVTSYLEIDPATLDLQVLLAGTDNVVLEIPNVELKGHNIYTAFAIGFADGSPGLEAWLLTDHVLVPHEMPKTGFGGAEQASSAYLWLSLVAIIVAVSFMIIRSRQTIPNQ